MSTALKSLGGRLSSARHSPTTVMLTDDELHKELIDIEQKAAQ